MEPFEEKLKKYFDQVQPDGEFMDRLKALESSPEAKPPPRGKPRRWVTPVAAGVAAALALGTGWAYLRGTDLEGSARAGMAAAAVAMACAETVSPEMSVKALLDAIEKNCE